MRIWHLLPLIAASAVGVLSSAPAVAASAPPSHEVSLSAGPATIVGCGSTIVEGTGYAANEPVQVTVVTTPAPSPGLAPEGAGDQSLMLPRGARQPTSPDERVVLANDVGTFGLMVALSDVGSTTITATGTVSGRSSVAVATVVPPACSGGPASGNYSRRALVIGAAVAGGGGLLVVGSAMWWRRRYHANRA